MRKKGLGRHWIWSRQIKSSPLVIKSLGRDARGSGEDFEERTKDFCLWCHYYFEEIFTLECPKYQIEWMDWETERRLDTGRREWTVAFRGASKSTIKAVLAPLWRIVNGLESYVVWIGSTEMQAFSRRQALMYLLEDNQKLIKDYGNLVPRPGEAPWSRERAVTSTGIFLESYGVSSVPRGLLRGSQRPSMIIMDDINDENNQSTPGQRQKLLSKFDDVIMKLGPPDGSCNYIGVSTPDHSEGIESHIKNRGSWTYKEYPGILAEPDNKELWDKMRIIYLDLRLGADRKEQAKEFFQNNKTKMLRGAKVAWPAVASYYDYYIQRLENPGSFAKEIGLPLPIGFQPLDPETQKLPVETCSLFRIRGNKIIMTRGPRTGDEIDIDYCYDYGFLDPAVGLRVKGDYTAICRVLVDEYGYKYLAEVWCKIADKNEYLRAYIDMHRRRAFDIAGFEANGFQSYLKDEWERIEREEYHRGLRMNIVRIKNKGNKLARMVTTLQAPMTNHHLAIHEYIVYNKPEVWTQFINLGSSTYDDAPDAVSSCLRMINSYAT